MCSIKNITLIFSLLFLLVFNALGAGSDPFDRSSITIYPNPVMYEANISIDKDIDLNYNEVSLFFFNVVGEVVHEVSHIEYHDFKIDKEVFKKSGIYLFQLKMNGEVLKTGKVSIH